MLDIGTTTRGRTGLGYGIFVVVRKERAFDMLETFPLRVAGSDAPDRLFRSLLSPEERE